MANYPDPRLDPSSPQYNERFAAYYNEALAAQGGQGGTAQQAQDPLSGLLGLYALSNMGGSSAPAAATTAAPTAAGVAEGLPAAPTGLHGGRAVGSAMLGDQPGVLLSDGTVVPAPAGEVGLGDGLINTAAANPYLTGAALAAGTYLGNDYANKQGGITDIAWNGVNALNPFNAAISAAREYPNMLLHGGRLSTGAQIATALPTFGLSFLANPISDAFGSKKPGSQQRRDVARANLKDVGLIDSNYNLTLDDGTTFNIGKEDPWSDAEKSPYGGYRQYDLDLEKLKDPATESRLRPLIGGANALAGLSGSGHMAGYFINAATKSKDPYGQMRSWVDQMGGYDAVMDAIGQSNMAPDEKTRLQTGVNMLYGRYGYEKPDWNKPSTGTTETSSAAPKLGLNTKTIVKTTTPTYGSGSQRLARLMQLSHLSGG